MGTTSSLGSESTSPFIWSSPDIQISASYSAESVSPNDTDLTDLGTSTLRWKDLYLGGSLEGVTQINVNGGVIIKESVNSVLVTNNIESTDAPIEIDGCSTVDKERTLNLNTSNAVWNGTFNKWSTSISSNGVTASNSTNNTFISANNLTVASGLSNVVHLGVGLGKIDYDTQQVVLGGSTALRGVNDDGSFQYQNSDFVTRQARLRTSDALMNDISVIDWVPGAPGQVVQVKAYVLATDIVNAALIYSAEISGVYSLDDSEQVNEIGTPIVSEWNSFPSGDVTVEMDADNSSVYIKVQGNAVNTITWLVTYSYQRIVNIN